MTSTVRSGLAAVVLTVPVVTQLVRPGLTESVPGHLVFAGSQVLGWALVASVVRAAPEPARAASRWGSRTVVAACILQLLFGVAYAATALDGKPSEASFVLFLLGFLALLVGGLGWALALRAVPGARLSSVGLACVGILGAMAILVGTDPFHDVLLLSSYVSWVVVGRGFDVLRDAPEGARTSMPSTSVADVTW